MAVATPVGKLTSAKTSGAYDAPAFAKTTLAHWPTLAALFDHTLLKPEATREQVIQLCEEAATYRFACAMVNPAWTSLAVSALAGTGVPVGAVAGFPLGASLSTTKRAETQSLVTLGAKEIDMVINIGALKSGDHARVSEDIRGVVAIAHGAGAIVKVILETCLLTVQEKLLASELALQAGTDFLKTSTGFASGGATPADVAMLRGVAGTLCGVKASGGIKTLGHARAVLESGANRIGASASVAIVRELGAP
jgi:deoxyribose-phosphate aldolase